jgi:hypothetical protein
VPSDLADLSSRGRRTIALRPLRPPARASQTVYNLGSGQSFSPCSTRRSRYRKPNVGRPHGRRAARWAALRRRTRPSPPSDPQDLWLPRPLSSNLHQLSRMPSDMLSVQSEKDSLLKRPPLNATLFIDDGKPELAAAASLRRPQSSTRPRAPRLAPILIATCLFALVGSALTYGLLPDISSASGRSPVASSAPSKIRKTCPSQPAGRIADRSQWVSRIGLPGPGARTSKLTCPLLATFKPTADELYQGRAAAGG